MRPIYAEKLKNSYGWWEGNDRQLTRDEARHYFDAMIDAQPTADAEPVKHGKWVLNERGVYQCECGFVPTMEEKIYYNYCPNCGAKMDELELTTSAELHPEKYLKNLNGVKE